LAGKNPFERTLGEDREEPKERIERTLGEDRTELLEGTLGWKEPFGEDSEEPEERSGKNPWRGRERTLGKNPWGGQGGTRGKNWSRTGKNSWKEPLVGKIPW